MGLTNPPQSTARPFQDVLSPDQPFVLDGARILAGVKTDFGEGEMVLLRVRGQEDELSIWGTYLVNQVKAAVSSDFGKRYVLTSEVVDGFSKRPVKILKLHDDTNHQGALDDDAESPSF